ncbi:acyl carrier protein [Streptomyces sp. NBC_00103]|uniref:acyl carrier protein n=1 Tax=Streptomyces sp. NBC_00103 TaxID=2975653 RepID=UPI00224DF09B|nr:acyl carrier protein [Streptomyces sp. NBC_00103]MCX5372729.1 acyl carrier protein [Streptomyces sp. NBC_00103]
MAATEFTLPDLRTILLEAAGTDEDVDLDGDIANLDFQDLGYESLALLETAGRIERAYGISLDEEAFTEARTPRALIDLVNSHLSAARAA